MEEFNFKLIYELYVKNVFKFLFKLTQDYYLAEELTQETFVRAFSNIDKFMGKSKLIVWLCQIGKNLYFDYLKKSNRTVDIENLTNISSKSNIEEIIIRKDNIEIISKLALSLCEPYRTVFFYKMYLELTYKEIANDLEKSENWVRVTFYRAKCIIQKKIKEMEK